MLLSTLFESLSEVDALIYVFRFVVGGLIKLETVTLKILLLPAVILLSIRYLEEKLI